MKKILAILMILVLVGGVAFAQLTPQVTAKASVNWGIDFGAGKNAKAQHGFENLLDAKVVIPLYMGTLNSKTEGDVRMNFDLGVNLAYRFYDQLSNSASPHVAWDSDAEFKLWRKTLSDMSASIHFFGGYMNVYGRPDFSTNYAQIWSPIRDNGIAWGPETSGDITGFGTKLGYASDDLAGTGLKFDAGLKFGSNGSWKAKGTTSQDKFKVVDLKAGDTLITGATYYAQNGYDAEGKPIFSSTPAVFAAPPTVGAAEAGKYLVKTTSTAAGPAASGLRLISVSMQLLITLRTLERPVFMKMLQQDQIRISRI